MLHNTVPSPELGVHLPTMVGGHETNARIVVYVVYSCR